MGGMLAVLRDLLDQTLRSADEISALLGLPVLGAVPAMPRRQKPPISGQRVRLQPDSPEAEAFRTIRTAVFFGAPKDEAKTMLVTSPAAGDGKSTLASNLAIAMAQAGQKTVLVDADLRKPMQGVIFGSNHDDQGMSTVLAGKSKLGQAIQSTPVKGLSLLPSGPHVSNPAEILNSGRFAEVLRRLSEVYDRVLIDAPPVTVVTDAQILGALCDVTILVLRAEKSTRKLSFRAIDALNSVGSHLLGAVVNDVRRGGDRYGYYGTYSASSGSNGSGRSDTKMRKAPVIRSRAGGRQSTVGLPLQGAESPEAQR
jgi:capsular exopolysaccharide synthesis family protein